MRAYLDLSASGDLSFPARIKFSDACHAKEHASKVLKDSTKRQLAKEARSYLELPASGDLSFPARIKFSYACRAIVPLPARTASAVSPRYFL